MQAVAEASAEAAHPVPPRRAHGTLQPQDESVIVGYYTSTEVRSRGLQCPYKLKIGGVLWQEAMALIAPAQEI